MINMVMQVLVLGPDAAAVRMTNIGVIKDTAEVAVELTSHVAQVWVREAGQWKVLMARISSATREQ